MCWQSIASGAAALLFAGGSRGSATGALVSVFVTPQVSTYFATLDIVGCSMFNDAEFAVD